MMILIRRLPAALLALSVAGCVPCPYPAAQAAPVPSAVPAATPSSAPSTVRMPPVDSVRVVEVLMATVDGGASGKFSPQVVRARQGDLLRFRMADGHSIHNVSFVVTGNDTRGAPLPADGPFLTSEGQSWQIRIDLPPGRYAFICQPHAQAGHAGTLVVEP